MDNNRPQPPPRSGFPPPSTSAGSGSHQQFQQQTSASFGNSHLNRHSYIAMAGPLIPPSNSMVRQYIMGGTGTTTSATTTTTTASAGQQQQRPLQSNLTALLQRHDEEEKQRGTTRQGSSMMELPTTTATAAAPVVDHSNEADSASGPPISSLSRSSTTPHSAPVDAAAAFLLSRRRNSNTSAAALQPQAPPVTLPPPPTQLPPSSLLAASLTTTQQPQTAAPHQQQAVDTYETRPRRCLSSKELGTLAPPSGSPYAYMLYQKEMLEAMMRQRLQQRRESVPRSQSSSPPLTTTTSSIQQQLQHLQHLQQRPPFTTTTTTTTAGVAPTSDLDSSLGSNQASTSAQGGGAATTADTAATGTAGASSTTVSGGMNNERRNRRRAEHNQAVISDLCEIVADLFIAEAKLLNPSSYGVVEEDEKTSVVMGYHHHHHHSSPSSSSSSIASDNPLLSLRRRRVLQTVQAFISSLPTRYALGVETPSEVLVHMRLMSAVRANDSKAVVHIVNLDEPGERHHQRHQHHYTLTSASSTRTNSSNNIMLTISSYPELKPVFPSTPPHRKQQPQPQQQHSHNIQQQQQQQQHKYASNRRSIRLVTIACGDADGLLEYITKLLGTGGSRVLDADVMLSRDNIVLDRFVVEMNGRLRLDKLANYIECFLKEFRERSKRQSQQQLSGDVDDGGDGGERAPSPEYGDLFTSSSTTKQQQLLKTDHSPGSKSNTSSGSEPSGPLYVPSSPKPTLLTRQEMIQEEMESAVPLTTVLAIGGGEASSTIPMVVRGGRGGGGGPGLAASLSHPLLRRLKSMPTYYPLTRTKSGTSQQQLQPTDTVPAIVSSSVSHNVEEQMQPPQQQQQQQQLEHPPEQQVASSSMRQRRPLVNRQATSDLDQIGDYSDDDPSLGYVTVPNWDYGDAEGRFIPLIPFEDLMLIETLGTGRVSTIYRAAWRRTIPPYTIGSDPVLWGPTTATTTTASATGSSHPTHHPTHHEYVQMVALKVAMVNPATRDTANVDELRREGDIAARLQHPNICDLVGVAADSECFCLAFDFCEGGSLLSLLSDTSRYYEYLPIALDVANGMAYLHSRNVIHRDLKPSNILLSKDHRAKIADFGMSVNFAGQELTAETGTYRYMAPEVIRHESYSSNADVYSFGICLWQLITREIPFATMTPIQAAYAVAEGRRPDIPEGTPRRLQEIITACWDQDSQKRPSFTYIALALADYAKMAFSPANVGAQTLHIANEMLASVEGNSTVNVDFSTLVTAANTETPALGGWLCNNSIRYNRSWQHADSQSSDGGGNIGLEI